MAQKTGDRSILDTPPLVAMMAEFDQLAAAARACDIDAAKVCLRRLEQELERLTPHAREKIRSQAERLRLWWRRRARASRSMTL